MQKLDEQLEQTLQKLLDENKYEVDITEGNGYHKDNLECLAQLNFIKLIDTSSMTGWGYIVRLKDSAKDYFYLKNNGELDATDQPAGSNTKISITNNNTINQYGNNTKTKQIVKSTTDTNKTKNTQVNIDKKDSLIKRLFKKIFHN